MLDDVRLTIREKLFGPPTLRVFVYGTLKLGYVNHDRYCQGCVSVTPAMIRGRMYSFGIPAITVENCDIRATGTYKFDFDLRSQELAGKPKHDLSSPIVYGDLLEFSDPYVLRYMDQLEGFSPGYATNLYDRVLVPVYPEDKSPTHAWVYTSAVAEDEKYRVPEGRWPINAKEHKRYYTEGV